MTHTFQTLPKENQHLLGAAIWTRRVDALAKRIRTPKPKETKHDSRAYDIKC